MKQVANSLEVAGKLSGALLPLILIAAGFPLLILLGFGIYFVIAQGHLLSFFVLMVLTTLLTFAAIWWYQRQEKKDSPEDAGEALVSASTDWGDFDREVWDNLNGHIVKQLQQEPDFPGLKNCGVELISLTATHYQGDGKYQELAFSAPELLKMIEEISRRYRKVLKAHIPFVEKIRLSTVKGLYDHKDKAKLLEIPWHGYRAYRIFSPLGILAEARGQIMSKVFGGVSSSLQFKLKQALLQEVLSVAIDLYSGRFQITDDEIDQSQIATEDQTRMAAPLEPLRVCLLGQISAGKSSLVNALTKDMRAEVNLLPSTEEVRIHQCSLEGIDTLHLVDLPGLDGNADREKLLLEQISQCDLLLWVLKANQPARALDADFKQVLDTFYADKPNRSRKRTPIIGVLNQVDQLKPVADWKPPYDLEEPDTAKAKTMVAALAYNREILNLEQLLPLSISDSKEWFNLSELENLLQQQYDKGIQVQLNRRRVESGSKFEFTEQAKRVYQAGKSLFGLMRDQSTQQHTGE